MVAMVTNLRTGTRFTAVRGGGSQRNGRPISVGAERGLADAIVAVNARPPVSFRPKEFGSMRETALDIATVADGHGFDGSVDFDDDRIGVWDYLAAVMIVREAGGFAADAFGRELVTLDHSARRRPVAATSQRLLHELLVAAREDSRSGVERYEQVDRVAVGIVDGGVALSPERVPRGEVTVVTGRDEPVVDGIDVGGASRTGTRVRCVVTPSARSTSRRTT